ncbi:hypothetical protein HOY82DRAFT_600844 [Tuber indicum]|nr:hypothetical protein HOY82DRAFT_600844 [Tuber indicum]
MPALPGHPIETLPSQVGRCDYEGDKAAGDSNGEDLLAIVGIIVAALTLLVGILALRSSRFHRWASHLLPSQFAQGASGITPPAPAPSAIPAAENFHAVGVTGIPTPGPNTTCDHYPNADPAYRHTNTPSLGHNGIS